MNVSRWQYPWIALTLTVIGIALASLYLTGVSSATVFAALIAGGLGLIVVRPRLYAYTMIGIGVSSVVFAGVLMLGDSSLLTVAVLTLVGVGAVVRGVHTHLFVDQEQ
ncbi:hypothetical protein SAMN04487967_1730 [Natronorubrum sediminis]|uniref:Uncharacterized protein n=1 Tax=Natronorubrum sediminis TaxID=640943 RepID=A0A1H6FV93_9EURY|nr:hypothetical protein [Natronorubrum sediminis]SEH14709.1 hypothetical protein SAMN04487967_1730 [Natronorubrum sediminis]